jgi:hypothetical protein
MKTLKDQLNGAINRWRRHLLNGVPTTFPPSVSAVGMKQPSLSEIERDREFRTAEIGSRLSSLSNRGPILIYSSVY